MTNNNLLKLMKKQRNENVSMDIVGASLAKSKQVFLCCNQLNSFNGTDLSWALRVVITVVWCSNRCFLSPRYHCPH